MRVLLRRSIRVHLLLILPLLLFLHLTGGIGLLAVKDLTVHAHRLREFVLHFGEHLCEFVSAVKQKKRGISRCFVLFSSALRCSLAPRVYACSYNICAWGKRRKSRSPYAAI